MAEKKYYYAESQAKYKKKYWKEKVDRIMVLVPKGQKEEIKKYADAQGVSMNRFIVNCVMEKIADIEFFKDI